MRPVYNILVVDDEENVRKLLAVVFSQEGHNIIQAKEGQEAVVLFQDKIPDIVFMDIRMPNMDGITALKAMRKISAEVPVILLTAYAAVETAVEALKLGAFDYIVKPFDLDELKLLMSRALQLRNMKNELNLLHRELSDSYQWEKILTLSPKMMELCRDIAKVSQTKASVLITGESGTGKELIAKAIHYNSPRATGPFIKINCGALPETLLESTLFGHEKGAFTGAQYRQEGVFGRADNGTLFLDEVAEMSANLQVKLLRVLQEREFEPLGSSRTIKTNFRLIAATNRDLAQMVDEGSFRQDLFYRLNVVSLSPLPLKKRPEDILLLARHFLQKFSLENSKDIMDFSTESVEYLKNYHWPGNVRELSNAVERAVIMSTGLTIFPEDLPENITLPRRPLDPPNSITFNESGHCLKEQLKTYEKELINNALRNNQGHRELTAKELGISRRTLLYKLQEYQIE